MLSTRWFFTISGVLCAAGTLTILYITDHPAFVAESIVLLTMIGVVILGWWCSKRPSPIVSTAMVAGLVALDIGTYVLFPREQSIVLDYMPNALVLIAIVFIVLEILRRLGLTRRSDGVNS